MSYSWTIAATSGGSGQGKPAAGSITASRQVFSDLIALRTIVRARRFMRVRLFGRDLAQRVLHGLRHISHVRLVVAQLAARAAPSIHGVGSGQVLQVVWPPAVSGFEPGALVMVPYLHSDLLINKLMQLVEQDCSRPLPVEQLDGSEL
jgi:hypothetical protein